MFPECFDITKETSQADQLRQIAKILDDLWFLRNSSYIDTHSENVSMILGDIVVDKIFNEAFTSDSAKTPVKPQSVSESVKSILKEKIQEERRILKENSNPEKTKLSEEQKKKQRIRQISYHHKNLLKKLADHERKSDIPAELRKGVAEILSMIDFVTDDGAEPDPKKGKSYRLKSGQIKYPKDFARFKAIAEKIANEEYNLGIRIAPDFVESCATIVNEVQNLSVKMSEVGTDGMAINLKKLSLKSLDKVYYIINNLRKAIFNYNQVRIDGKVMKAADIAAKIVEEVQANHKKVKREWNHGLVAGIDKLINFDVLRPLDAMYIISETLEGMGLDIVNRQDVMMQDITEDVEAQMSQVFPSTTEKRQWLSNFKGGMMFFLGCHIIDIIVSIMGVPKNIVPFIKSTGIDGTKSEDFGMAVLEYKMVSRLQSAVQQKFQAEEDVRLLCAE